VLAEATATTGPRPYTHAGAGMATNVAAEATAATVLTVLTEASTTS
jgi:hypothetical protein